MLQPVVAFAGEHCHPSFYSTGHGAFLTGRSAAQLMIRYCGTENFRFCMFMGENKNLDNLFLFSRIFAYNGNI